MFDEYHTNQVRALRLEQAAVIVAGRLWVLGALDEIEKTVKDLRDIVIVLCGRLHERALPLGRELLAGLLGDLAKRNGA